MKFEENGKEWESFIYVPKQPVAVNPDGSWNTQKVCELIVKAKAGDETATMQLFEQYQYLWKKSITSFVEDMLSYEDAQQEAFYIFMVALQSFQSEDLLAFTGYYKTALHNHLTNLTGKMYDEQKEWLYSLDEVDEEGNPLHDLEDNSQSQVDTEMFPRVRPLLSAIEYKVVLAHYHMGLTLKEIAKLLNNNYDYIREVNAKAIKKLKVLL